MTPGPHRAGGGRAGQASAPSIPGSRPLRLGASKILVIMEENHSIGQVFPSGMPYLWRLARRYARATAWRDVGHPSLPNYLAIFGGSAFGEPQDCLPGPGCIFRGPSVFGQTLRNGKAVRAYEESMPVKCDHVSSGNYDVNHNPWAYFPSERRTCLAGDLPAGTVAAGPLATDVRRGTLPAVGLLTPNLVHDAHNGTLAQADRWLRSWVPVLMSGPDWRAGRLAIVVVFDEGVSTERVPFVIMAPGLSGVVTGRALDHYDLTRLIDEVAGVRPLRQAARASHVARLFGLSRRSGHDPLRYRYLTNVPHGIRTLPYGYNLVDVGPYRSVIDALPARQRALVWIGGYSTARCAFDRSDANIRHVIGNLAGDRKVAGFYIDDEADDALPDVGGHCPDVVAQVAARSRLVRRLAPGTFSYEVVTEPAHFAEFARATDVLGADPYPCLRGRPCDWSMIPRYLAALRAAHVTRYWGVLQAFATRRWRYPTRRELARMVAQWQRSDWQGEQTFTWSLAGLSRHPGLLTVLGAVNRGRAAPPPR